MDCMNDVTDGICPSVKVGGFPSYITMAFFRDICEIFCSSSQGGEICADIRLPLSSSKISQRETHIYHTKLTIIKITH